MLGRSDESSGDEEERERKRKRNEDRAEGRGIGGGEDKERGCGRWRKDDRGEGDSAKGVDLPSVLSPIILSSRVSLTNVARSSDPSAIHDDVRRGRPGDGRAATATPNERQPPRLSHDQTRTPTCAGFSDMRPSARDSRRTDASREIARNLA